MLNKKYSRLKTHLTTYPYRPICMCVGLYNIHLTFFYRLNFVLFKPLVSVLDRFYV
jgi:hypothetical protein